MSGKRKMKNRRILDDTNNKALTEPATLKDCTEDSHPCGAVATPRVALSKKLSQQNFTI